MSIAKCVECGKEYQLEPNEKASDFQCKCGGELTISSSTEISISREINLDETVTCQACGAETPVDGNFCCECGENFSTEKVPESLDYDDSTAYEIIKKKGKTLQEHRAAMNTKFEGKEYSYAFKIQNKIDKQGYCTIKGGFGRFFTILNDGIETAEEELISYHDMKSIEVMNNKSQKKAALGALLFTPYLMKVSGYKTIEIKFKGGKITLNDVKKADALGCKYYIKQIIS